ncbi:hypothetical protein H2199_004682 [Coniosporium tulheliwenetii]|uniref:Uncharacterized protein n=1 Tax=Coniosporium tulheliwenetii TaxID=3383036 RepID=A0ACC2Z533_9PEZI|nr:hypothetical protein H2199_004682 [Cladosporium sp. JES 115]
MLAPNIYLLVTGALCVMEALCQAGYSHSPLVKACGTGVADVLCVNNYAAVLPYHFYRDPIINATYESAFGLTIVGNDTSFHKVENASFLVFDKKRGLEILGDAPNSRYMFNENGSNLSIATFNTTTNKTTTIVNNYYGFYFNCVNDLVVDSKGDIWFTDPMYSWFNALVDTPPQLPTATYRFRPSTGAVTVVDDSMKTLYIAESGAVSGTWDYNLTTIHGSRFNHTAKRGVYAFTINDAPNGSGRYLTNRHPIYLTQDRTPDGLKVAANGYVVTASGKGVNVVDPVGTLLVRIQTNFSVQNYVWTGREYDDLWIMGRGGVQRVQWNLTGQVLK